MGMTIGAEDSAACNECRPKLEDDWENKSPLSAPHREYDAVVIVSTCDCQEGRDGVSFPCPHGCGEVLRFTMQKDGRLLASHKDCSTRPRRHRGL